MRVLVLYGGDSPEREVSLRSGAAINSALQSAGIETILFDSMHGDERLHELASRVDMIFPILHGKNGEDGVIQEKLESINLPFLGSDSTVSALCFNKQKTHNILESVGIKMPSFTIVSADSMDSQLFTKPFVLKPVEGGSSLDTLVAREVTDDVLVVARNLLQKYDSMLLEELIDGQEITVSVLGDQTLPVIAVVPPMDGEFDYANKYNGASQELCPAPIELVSEEIQKRAQNLALEIHQLLGARHLSRTDIIVSKSGELYVLELNTMPGMTNQSLFPAAAQAAGYSMEQFVLKLIDLVQK